MEDADIDVASVTPLTPNRAQSWLLEPLSCDTELTRFSKPHTHAEELRQEAQKHIVTNYTDCTHYYTDGSKASQGTGCAFVSDAGNGSRSLPKGASVFTAELTAILMCLGRILHNTDDCAIFTDSLSSIQGLRDTSSDAPLRMSILERVREADRRGIAVTIVWVPSHVGLTGNESADRAAKAAALDTPGQLTLLPANDLSARAREYMTCQWQGGWEREPTTNKLKELKPSIGLWASSSQRSRREEVTLTRLRIGHTYDTHGYLLSGDEAPLCHRCDSRRSIKHVLTECGGLASERRRFFGGHQSFSDLVGESPNIPCDVLMKYSHAAGFRVIYTPV